VTWLDDFVTSVSILPDRVREELWARGVTDEQITLYRIGHLNGELPSGDLPIRFREWCGVGERLNDVFVLPLTNVLGEVRGLQLRHVEKDHGGYMTYMEVNDEAILFGLGQAAPHLWRSGGVLLVEGAFDVFPIQRVFPGTVSTVTARLTDHFLRLLRRLVTHVWLGYDNDDTGRRAAQQIQRQHGDVFTVHVLEFPKVPLVGTTKVTKDPNDLWSAWGDTKFQEFIKARIGKEYVDA
jgi:DNA primase